MLIYKLRDSCSTAVVVAELTALAVALDREAHAAADAIEAMRMGYRAISELA